MGYTHANYLRLGVTASNPHAPRATAKGHPPLQAGARSTRRGLGVGAVDSLGKSFVWGGLSDRSLVSLHSQRVNHYVVEATIASS